MKCNHLSTLNRIIVLLTFLIMVTVNILANTLPINGVTSAEVSDSYPNLFAPAGLTFAIWGLIYLLLALYTLYHLGLFSGKRDTVNQQLLCRVGIYFSLSSVANALWIFSWHGQIIPVSLVLIVIMLFCLIRINQLIRQHDLNNKENFLIKLPFAVYFGWITVATIANVVVLLVSLGWDGFGIPETVWTVVVLGVGLLIGAASTIRFQSVAYGLVLIWAYTGILIKHLSSGGFSGQYPAVVIAAIIAIAGFIAALLVVLFGRKRDPLSDNR